MDTDLFEFSKSHARNSDPDTSRQAASDPRLAFGAATLMARIMDAYFRHGDMTTFEAADRMGIDHQKVWKRCSDLLNKGLLFDSGRRRKSPSNRDVMVLTMVRPE